MDDKPNYYELVIKAKLGCNESLTGLAESVRPAIRVYIYRLTLDDNLTEDLVQETMLEMVRSLKKLRKPEAFWAWLYRTALSKVQHHYRVSQKERMIQNMSTADKEHLLQKGSSDYGDGLKSLMSKELAEQVLDTMATLRLRHRNILVLRCCENLPYSQISEIMGCTQLAAQTLLFRAKLALKKKLSRHGLGKAMVITALGIFSQITKPAKAAEVSISATASSAKVGVTASIIGAAGTKMGFIAAVLIILSLITTSLVSSFYSDENSIGYGGGSVPSRSEVRSFHYVKQAWDKTGSPNPNLARGRSLSKGAYEQWYYLPDGIGGPLFMMMQRWDPRQESKLCGWLQNGSGNYYYHSGEETIYLYNYHLPMRYLNTRRLPIDGPEFTEFLDEIEGRDIGLTYTRDPNSGLLTGVLDDRFYNAADFQSSFSYNTLDESDFDSFRYPWPEDALVIDERDRMHQRGWTYFRLNGQINGRQVAGYGQVPFIYNTADEHRPWLKLSIGDEFTIIDTVSQAYVLNGNDEVIAAYPGGSFFQGLSQPWMGMHTVDMVRRNAANKKIRFTTKSYGGDNEHYGKAEIILLPESAGRIVYTIDIDNDLVEAIEFAGDGDSAKQGILRFTYLDEIEQFSDEFIEPGKTKIPRNARRESLGILWLAELMQGTLVK